MKIKKIDAYFLDLDGTLIDIPNYKDELSDENKQYLTALNNTKGKYACIATGRINSDVVLKIAKDINAPYVICNNGAIIVNQNNEIIKLNAILEEDAKNIINEMQERQLFFILNGDQEIYCPQNVEAKFERPWVSLFTKKPYAQMPKKEQLTKILVYGLDKDDTAKLKEEWTTKYPNLFFHTVSFGYSLEITHKNASKGQAIKYICEEVLKINPLHSAHLGDSGNDLSAKGFAGYFVAMGNASDDIKEQADYVGEDYAFGGVAKTIQKLEEIQKDN